MCLLKPRIHSHVNLFKLSSGQALTFVVPCTRQHLHWVLVLLQVYSCFTPDTLSTGRVLSLIFGSAAVGTTPVSAPVLVVSCSVAAVVGTSTDTRSDTATRSETHLSIFWVCAARHSLTVRPKKGLHRTILDT